jgi:M6 family metalloprotease-like protein
MLFLSSCEYFTELPLVDTTDPVDIIDTTAPIITLIGGSTIILDINDNYEELGATCIDDIDSTCQVIIDDSNVNTSIAGSYQVYYTATDASGNIADRVTRTVIIKDDDLPLITLLGEDTIYLDISDTYIDLGVSCSNYDPSCEVTIDDSAVDMTTPGTYIVYYHATNSGSTEMDLERTVIVEDHSDRKLIIPTDDIIYHLLDEPWTYPSVYVPDEDDYTAILHNEVDPTTPGIYEIFYELTDELDNTYMLKYYVHVLSEIPIQKDIAVLDNIYFTYPSLFTQLIAYDTNNDLILDSNEIKNVLSLDLSHLDIQNIDFITEYIFLNTLDLSYNDLYDLDFMDSLNLLKHLNVDSNHLDFNDISILTNNNFLQSINLSNNFVQELSYLDGLSRLENLNVSNNIIYDLSTIGALPSLSQLDVSDNPIDDFDPILNFINLKSLNIDQTNITAIDGIEDLESLNLLTLNKNIIDYYDINYLFNLNQLNIPNLNADLEYSFFFDYLESFGINVNVNSLTPFDTINPNIILSDTSFTINEGETFDFDTLDFYIYDSDDLYIYDGLEANVLTSTLSVGNHMIQLSYTDSDGHTSSIDFNVNVIDTYELGNIVIFIRFSDETTYEAPNDYNYYYDLFNGQTYSLKDYYLEVSNETYEIDTVFPSTDIIYYTDTHPRGYYQPFNQAMNRIGYRTDDDKNDREYALLSNSIYWLENSRLLDESVVLDYNNDGRVDVVTFLISGQVDEWADLIWPHQYAFYDSFDDYGDFNVNAPSLNGSYVFKYTFQLIGNTSEESEYFNLGVFCHEMFHVISATDLYHYYSDDDFSSVGNWDIMDHTTAIPSHMLLYMKEYYGGWEQDDFNVSQDGTYSLNVSTSLTDNLIIIDLGYSNEYLYIEYRTQTGDYEANIPDDGVIIYRVDKDYKDNGNVDGYYSVDLDDIAWNDVGLDEVFVFRPLTYDASIYTSHSIYYIVDDGDADLGMLQLSTNDEAGPNTNIPLFFSDGTEIEISISLISEDLDHVELLIDFLN